MMMTIPYTKVKDLQTNKVSTFNGIILIALAPFKAKPILFMRLQKIARIFWSILSMLNKEICRKCCSSVATSNPLQLEIINPERLFEERWKVDLICCPVCMQKLYISKRTQSKLKVFFVVGGNLNTSAAIPEQCLYLLEQTVNNA
jgi:uncharacterized protein YbaR (Trm112 family)